MHGNQMNEMSQQRRCQKEKSWLNVEAFLIVMLLVIAIQSTHLGYTVGVLTNIERQFLISSGKSGSLLSNYDVGHTLAVVLLGIFATNMHLPRITAVGVILSAVSMFLLTLPVILFGFTPFDHDSLTHNRRRYIRENVCDPLRVDNEKSCEQSREEHIAAFAILSAAQFVAGVASAPFNTVAYVYIDSNLELKSKSPFYLGLLSSMYAMGPVFGFALSAGLTRIYSTITDPPSNIDINSNEWVGAWWLGYIICGILYLLCAFPLFLFPKTLLSNERDSEYVELQRLRHGGNLNYSIRRHHEVHLRLSRQQEEQESPSAFQRLKNACRGFSFMASELIQNPVFVLAVIAWTFGSYLAGGYTTYLPKYVETQYGRSASIADIYAGIISVGSVAVSTAIGGYLLTRFNFSPRRAALCLMACWSAITITYLLGMLVGCDEPAVNELIMDHNIGRLRFQGISTCNFECHCDAVSEFNPVHYRNTNYYSPCHAGCMQYDEVLRKWSTCYCTPSGSVENGLKLKECNQIYAYVAIMFVGLFCGNLFFMANMMIVLRSVYDEQKVMALSFASCITNVLGFIPAPILFGWLIDSACILWRSRCVTKGNCVIYDNASFRWKFHAANAVLQFLAVIAVVVCYGLMRTYVLPEEETEEDDRLEGEDQVDGELSFTKTPSSKDVISRRLGSGTIETDL